MLSQWVQSVLQSEIIDCKIFLLDDLEQDCVINDDIKKYWLEPFRILYKRKAFCFGGLKSGAA